MNYVVFLKYPRYFAFAFLYRISSTQLSQEKLLSLFSLSASKSTPILSSDRPQKHPRTNYVVFLKYSRFYFCLFHSNSTNTIESTEIIKPFSLSTSTVNTHSIMRSDSEAHNNGTVKQNTFNVVFFVSKSF